MNVRELYTFLNEKIPPELSCEWDNDGLMVCPDENKPVKKALFALDVTAVVADAAIAGGYDVILSHHPMVFHPIKSMAPDDAVRQKGIKLLLAGVSVMSFHTRLDAVSGGVNDQLARALGLCNAVPFGEDGIGRIGTLAEEISLDAFADKVKRVLDAGCVMYSGGTRPCRCVAVLGGGGADDADAAFEAGADTYLTGELKHHQLTDAPERGVNLLCAGHFDTENLVLSRLEALVKEADAAITTDVINSDPIKIC